MKTSRFQKEYRKSASKLHKKIGDLLKGSELGSYKIYQEYPVQMVNDSYHSGREHFDWVIVDLKVVIECHGEQHYKPIAFGKEDLSVTLERFNNQKIRDQAKEAAARDIGWGFICLSYQEIESITQEQLVKLVKDSIGSTIKKESAPSTDWKDSYQKSKEWREKSGIAEEQRKKASEYRKKKYRLFKDIRRKKDAEDK